MTAQSELRGQKKKAAFSTYPFCASRELLDSEGLVSGSVGVAGHRSGSHVTTACPTPRQSLNSGLPRLAGDS